MPRRGNIAGCAAILLLATALFLCSPWHKHTRYQTCGFTDFEHGGAIRSDVHPVVARPVVLHWRNPGEAPLLLQAAEPISAFGRAPPAVS